MVSRSDAADRVREYGSQELFDERDLERVYRLKVSWQRRARREGRLPYLKIGRLVRYARSEIDKFLSKHAVIGAQRNTSASER